MRGLETPCSNCLGENSHPPPLPARARRTHTAAVFQYPDTRTDSCATVSRSNRAAIYCCVSLRGRRLWSVRIIDQHGRRVPSGRRLTGSQVFDVAVGPSGNKIRFVPDTLNISVGDTVRWTRGSDDHSVTSGTPCTADGQFCSPDNMNCDAGILSNTGAVYERTFTQAGTYSYFCALHCFAGMTGVINVTRSSRPHPTPRLRPSPHPRPVSP